MHRHRDHRGRVCGDCDFLVECRYRHTGLAVQEFTASSGASTAWGVDTTGGVANAVSASVSFPKLTPSGTGELYFSYAAVANTASAGTTSGFTYEPTTDGDMVAYDANLSAVAQPTATQSPSGVAGAVAVLVTAGGTSTTPPSLVAGQLGTATGHVAENNQLTLVPTVPNGCTAGDTLITMVTIEQDSSSHVGEVAAVPAGWQRLFEHEPTDGSPYQGWFALPNCSSGANSPSFVITSPGNSLGSIGTVVMGEYSGLPANLQVAFDDNDGWTSGTGDSLTGTGSTSGELVLTAVSYDNAANPTTPLISGDNWQLGGSSTASMSAAVDWEISGANEPGANSSWGPSTDYEVTMIGLEAGSSSENVVQEGQSTIASGTGTVTLPQGTTAHDALIAVIDTSATAPGAGYQATSITGGGLTWAPVVGDGGAGAETSEIWAGFDSSGTSGSTSITAKFPSGDVGEITVTEVAGISGVSMESGSTTARSQTGTSIDPTAAAVTPAEADDFLVGGLAAAETASLDTHPQPNWSTLPATSGEPSYASEWLANVLATSAQPQWDLYASAQWVVTLAAFTVS